MFLLPCSCSLLMYLLLILTLVGLAPSAINLYYFILLLPNLRLLLLLDLCSFLMYLFLIFMLVGLAFCIEAAIFFVGLCTCVYYLLDSRLRRLIFIVLLLLSCSCSLLMYLLLILTLVGLAAFICCLTFIVLLPLAFDVFAFDFYTSRARVFGG